MDEYVNQYVKNKNKYISLKKHVSGVGGHIDTTEKATDIIEKIKNLLKTDEFNYITQSQKQAGIETILNAEISAYLKISTVTMIILGSIKFINDSLNEMSKSQLELLKNDLADMRTLLDNLLSFKLKLENLGVQFKI